MYKNGKNITIIDHSVNSVDYIMKDLRKYKTLTKEQVYDLWIRIQQGNKKAFDLLVQHNMRFAMRIAKTYIPSGARLEDLFQAGCEGLVIAAHKFDASLGNRFTSFAKWYIVNEVSKTAYNYIKHNVISLDEPVDQEEPDGNTLLDRLASHSYQAADWSVRYNDALDDLKRRVEKRQSGLGRLTAELHQMRLDGYSTSDFARKHPLNERELTRLLTILGKEANLPLPNAA